ncbi:glutamyl-tRNA(Gln) amidotransferase subunit C, chloroplastic/mitochondrial [Brassica rapa]|uniref:Glutamyl-tRNA(Gln) amidotransferase subunit C, chloroplastic/mitochondrial n=1 Tax=Brassica campestris TaxID=3711 RepID=M4F0E7_BRACM|nr:glutamyl-tRNA(Gln) amidotransferase subunit C, chloroplastic/mitochondrial [Brassica rapa]
MATRALLAVVTASPPRMIQIKASTFSSSLKFQRHITTIARSFSSDTNPSVLQPPDVSRLAETARISLTPSEIEECGAKIRQVIDWFGQLQQVDVSSVEPAIRAEMEGGNLREDAPETFENRESIRASIPSFDEVYLKVPKVLNKE